MTIWRKFGEFDPSKDFFAWASSFAFYEAKNFQRVAARSRLHFDDELMERLAEERVPDLDHREARLAAMDRCIEELDDTEPRTGARILPEQDGSRRAGRAPGPRAADALQQTQHAAPPAGGVHEAPPGAGGRSMNAEPNPQELHRLFVAKADGTITPEEHERLSARC